jgi:dTDP-4-amino-4,6-dideoxygalactose transaminase
MTIYTSFPKLNNLNKKKILNESFKKFIESGNYILSNQTKIFERNFAKYIGTKYCIGVANGTDAIKIILKALDIGRNDEVIVSAHTAVASVVGIEESGAIPVLADIEHENYTIEFDSFKKLVSKRTKAVVLVHIFGQPCNLERFLPYCKNKKIKVIEDVAQAHGATYNGKKLGSFGVAGCFSFYPTKNLAALGDAGAITTSSRSLANKISQIRQYGWNSKRSINKYKGLNSRLDELQSFFLVNKLKFLDIENKKRNKIADKYINLLNENIIKPHIRSNAYHVFHIFCIKVKNRNLLVKYLEKRQIVLTRHYNKLIFKYNAYKKIKRDLKMTNISKLYKENLSLPIYPELSSKDQLKIIKTINSFFESRNK